jgi:hypothetical protein
MNCICKLRIASETRAPFEHENFLKLKKLHRFNSVEHRRPFNSLLQEFLNCKFNSAHSQLVKDPKIQEELGSAQVEVALTLDHCLMFLNWLILFVFMILMFYFSFIRLAAVFPFLFLHWSLRRLTELLVRDWNIRRYIHLNQVSTLLFLIFYYSFSLLMFLCFYFNSSTTISFVCLLQ